jgi:alpha-tubulin suppressor-like RCC1 family protein
MILFQLLNLKVFSVACGDHHSVVIGTSRDSQGQSFQIYSSENAMLAQIDKNKTLVYVWGSNSHSQLGLSAVTSVATPTLLETVLDFNFTKVSCGSTHTILLE